LINETYKNLSDVYDAFRVELLNDTYKVFAYDNRSGTSETTFYEFTTIEESGRYDLNYLIINRTKQTITSPIMGSSFLAPHYFNYDFRY